MSSIIVACEWIKHAARVEEFWRVVDTLREVEDFEVSERSLVVFDRLRDHLAPVERSRVQAMYLRGDAAKASWPSRWVDARWDPERRCHRFQHLIWVSSYAQRISSEGFAILLAHELRHLMQEAHCPGLTSASAFIYAHSLQAFPDVHSVLSVPAEADAEVSSFKIASSIYGRDPVWKRLRRRWLRQGDPAGIDALIHGERELDVVEETRRRLWDMERIFLKDLSPRSQVLADAAARHLTGLSHP